MPDKPKVAKSPPAEAEELTTPAEDTAPAPPEEAAPASQRPTRMQKRRVLTPRNG